MAVTYNDLDTMQKGKDAEVNELADTKIENDFLAKEQDLEVQEQEATQQEDIAMQEDALSAIEEMEKMSANGEDHERYYDNLPPVIQARVADILSGSINDAKAEQDEIAKQQGFEPIQPSGAVAEGDPMAGEVPPQAGGIAEIPEGMPQGMPVEGEGIPMEAQGIPQEDDVNITNKARQIASL